MTQAGPNTLRSAASRIILRVVTSWGGCIGAGAPLWRVVSAGGLSGEGALTERVLTATAQVIMETKN